MDISASAMRSGFWLSIWGDGLRFLKMGYSDRRMWVRMKEVGGDDR
jgi:hypothetical protein